MTPEVIFYQHASEWLGQRCTPPEGDAPAPRDEGRRWTIAPWRRRAATRSSPSIKDRALPKIVGISGSASAGSRTKAIVETALARVGTPAGAETHLISIADLVPHLGVASRGEAAAPLQNALHLIETADLLIVGSPVYKGSYTGLLKHLIDLLDYTALAGVPVALIATGGSDRHALVVEHHLRPLFGFFAARTLPTGLFITDKAIVDGIIGDAATSARFDQLVREATEALPAAARARAVAAE